MAAIPLTSLECSLEAERLLNQAAQTSDTGVITRRIAMADVYARLAHVAIIRETADSANEK